MDETLRENPEEPGFGASPPIPPLPELIKVIDHSPALERAARKTGWVLGRLVAAVREAQERARESVRENPSGKIRVITERSKAREQETGEIAASRLQEWGELARERGQEFARRAQEWWRRAQTKGRIAAQEKPVQVALAAGVAGFVLGVALRIRRAGHE
jgi:hypothetical protein